ncbi:MAG: NRDE family protein [Chitinophagaceae bacterium]|nr:NRDE family protein [Chitinophagaceae bacterium]
MGTVTYLPYKDKIFITSNRDDRPDEHKALAPAVGNYSTGKILFPKDVTTGGTWIGIHNNGNAMAMIKGAFAPHIRKDKYKESRSTIFLKIFDSENPVKKFNEIDLQDIEPFTLILWLRQNGTLWEMRWDEYEKFVKSLPADMPNMWSSVTLFDDKMVAARKKCFDQWREAQENITGDSIRHFHEHGGEGYARLNLSLNKGAVHTLSITSIEISEDRSVMYYNDMVTGEQTINGWLFADENSDEE